MDQDPLVRGMDPRIRIRTKMSRIPNTDGDGFLDGTFSLSTGCPGYQLHLQVSGDQGGSVHLPGIL